MTERGVRHDGGVDAAGGKSFEQSLAGIRPRGEVGLIIGGWDREEISEFFHDLVASRHFEHGLEGRLIVRFPFLSSAHGRDPGGEGILKSGYFCEEARAIR